MTGDYDDLDDDYARKHARSSDASTSHAAAEDTDAKRIDTAIVLAVYKAAGRPLATFEMEELAGGAQDGRFRKRRSDLSNEGVLRDSGLKKRSPKGREQIVWRLETDEEKSDRLGRKDWRAPAANPYEDLDDET